MSISGEKDTSGRKIIREIVVTYRLEGDEKGVDRSFRITNSGAGQVIDGVIWSDELIGKLNYAEDGRCVPVGQQKPGKGEWKTTSATADGGTDVQQTQLKSGTTTQALSSELECVWLHDENCMWSCYCPDH